MPGRPTGLSERWKLTNWLHADSEIPKRNCFVAKFSSWRGKRDLDSWVELELELRYATDELGEMWSIENELVEECYK